ncbi:MAG: ABC transporter substrate-binding protein [Bacteroidales bacterium]|nr:ABC transporter substrate-binding protein [Bacteroidales bacterium]
MKNFGPAFTALVLISLLFSCRGPFEQLDENTVFRYNESSNITSLDPAFARNQANIWGVNQVYNGLLQLNDKLEVEPCIAKNFEISEDGKTYTFHLRTDVYFHDSPCFPASQGRRVGAEDFVYSFRRILDPAVASPGAWVFRNVKLISNDQPAILALNDSTLVIELEQAFPPFPGLLTMQYCSVIPHEAVKYFGTDFRRNPVGTGPFRFGMWKEGVKLVLLKNPSYFETENGEPLPYLDAIAITFVVDKHTAFLEFIKGKLDFMSGIDASYKDELLTRSGDLNPKYNDRIQKITQPYLNTEYLAFQVNPELAVSKDNPLMIKEIRQAINHGFDRKRMMRFLRNNIGEPGLFGFVPPGLPSFDSNAVKGYNYNPVLARELLAKAGYPNGRGLPDITIATNASYLDLTRYIQHQLNELGFNICIDVNPPATLREMIAQARVPFFRASWIADYPDAENYLSLFYSRNFTPAGPNYTHFNSKDYDLLYEKAMTETIDSVRYSYYRQMDQIVMDQAPVVVLYYDQVLRFAQKNIRGLGSNAMNLLDLKKVKKTRVN